MTMLSWLICKFIASLIQKKDLIPENEVFTDKDGQVLYALPLPASELPLKLPEVENYQPSGNGESPLATISEWLDIWFDLKTGKSISRNQPKPDGSNWVSATRETNTMPQWAGSCWCAARVLAFRSASHGLDGKPVTKSERTGYTRPPKQNDVGGTLRN